jgi:hypothetical protein
LHQLPRGDDQTASTAPSRDANNIPRRFKMSATDKLVEKNCMHAELRFLASQGAVNIGLHGLTATSRNPLGPNSRSLTAGFVTRKSVFGRRV